MGQVLQLLGLFVLGLVVLSLGGELLVRGAARLARALGVSSLVIGLTIVAFGTSAPEAAVSIFAAIKGEAGIAIGNIVGSNIANLLLILGAAAVARPLRISLNLVRTDLPVMLLVTGVFLLLAADKAAFSAGPTRIERYEGLVFVLGLIGYTWLTYRLARREPESVEAEYEASRPQAGPIAVNLLLLVGGIGGLIGGADLIVRGASGMAELMGVDRRIIGLTVVAIGTSLPEMATCVVAARRNQPDIAVGNIVGSNIFNILSVAGLASLVRPLEIPRATLFFDAPVMLVVSLLAWYVCWHGRTVSRRIGVGLLMLYATFLVLTVMLGRYPPV